MKTSSRARSGRARRHAARAARSRSRRCLSGCMLTVEVPPAPVVDAPPKYREAAGKPHAALPAPDWWRGFRSRELTALVERAYLANLDIAAAVARIEQADAQTRIAGAPLLPRVDFDGTATRSRAHRHGAERATAISAVLNASYEIDFWGKNRAALRAARVQRDRQPLRPRGDRALDRRERHQHLFPGPRRAGPAAHRARECQRGDAHPRASISERIAVGTATGLDIAQQESLVAQQRATIPPLDQQVRQNIATLAVLLGEPPARLTVRGGSLLGDRAAARLARAAVRSAAAAPGHPRGRGAARRRQCQCGKRARRAVPEHLAHRPGRLRRAPRSIRCSCRRPRSIRSPRA